MKKEVFKIVAFFLMLVTAVSFTACDKSDDSDNDGDGTTSIVGLWTVESVSMDFTVDGKTLLEYMIGMGLPAEQAQILVDAMMTEMDDMSDMTGTIEMKADGTYEANFSNDDPDSDDTGIYELSDDGKKLTLDKGTTDEQIFDVITLTGSRLSIQMMETDEEDMDDDGQPEVTEMSITMNFTR